MRVTMERFILLTALALVTLIVYWSGLRDYIKIGASVFLLEATNSQTQHKETEDRTTSRNMPPSKQLKIVNRSSTSIVSQTHSNNVKNISVIKVALTTIFSHKSTKAPGKFENTTATKEISQTTARLVANTTVSTVKPTKPIKVENTTAMSKTSTKKPANIDSTTISNDTFFAHPANSGSRTTTAVYLKSVAGKISSTTVVTVLDKLHNRTTQDSKKPNVSLQSGNVSPAVDIRTAVLEKAGNGSYSDNERNGTLYIAAHDLTNGRLGNQMFRYASLLGIARAQGRELTVPPGSDLEETFKLQHVADNQASSGWPVVTEEHAYAFDTRLLNLSHENLRVSGFLQSYNYFEDYTDEVRQEFIFRDSVANDAHLIVDDLVSKRKGSLFVGVHIRRGDFLKDYNKQLGYGVPEKSYFLKAFDWMKSKFPNRNITYLVASDDLDWCKENLLSENVIPLPSASPAIHMAILTTCDHVIMSGGTFGWWSSFLAGGYVIYFKGYMTRGTTFGDSFTPEAYYPSLWLGFGN